MVFQILALLLSTFSGQAGAFPVMTRVGLPEVRDSLTVRVFAGYQLREITVGGAGLWFEGGDAGRESATSLHLVTVGQAVGGIGGRVSMVGIGSETVGDQITISAQDRRRVVRGVVTVISRDSQLIVTVREPFRDYLVSVLATEASPKDPFQYLMALSVLQRNYVQAHPRRHAADGADVCDNTHCQRSDLSGAVPRMYAAVDSAARLAMSVGSVYPCYYSVNCGGATLLPSQVWKGEAAGYSNVECPYCINSPNRMWQRTTPATVATDAIMRSAPAVPFVDDSFKTRLGRAVGFNVMRSNTVLGIERRNGVFVISGKGFGHRVGLCQEGALQLARNGRDAAEILRYYFPESSVSLRP